MVEYRIATNEDIELMMESRLEMLGVVNDLSKEYSDVVRSALASPR